MATLSIDDYDRRIIAILQTEGRISNRELAERVNLSPSPCLRRLRALEDAGLITAYTAEVDHTALGFGLRVLLAISMDEHTPERFSKFEDAIARLPEVQACVLITGQQADYQLDIATRDITDYQRLLLEHITRIPGVSGVHSSFVLRSVLSRRALPES